jgi:hypothetical protein
MAQEHFKITDKIELKRIINGRKDKMEDRILFKGDVIIERRRKDGSVIDKEELKNLVVNSGLEHIARWLAGETGYGDFPYIAIGLSGSGDAVDATDTELVSEVTRASATRNYVANYKCTFEKTFTFGSGEAYDIKEAGLFDGATPSGSTMFDRFVFSTKSVDADTDLYVKITITVASA